MASKKQRAGIRKKMLAKKLNLPQKLLPHVTRTELERVRDSELVDRIAENRESKPKPETMSAKFDPRMAAAAFLAGDDVENLATLLVGQVAVCCPISHGLDVAANFMKAMKPRTMIETMLFSEMFVTHVAVMRELENAEHSKNQESTDLHTSRAIRLGRLFCMQVETLQTSRGKGRQQVVVKHVRVDVGGNGQAIVGVDQREGAGGV